eukprot:763273-Rhodomonas_salina.2
MEWGGHGSAAGSWWSMARRYSSIPIVSDSLPPPRCRNTFHCRSLLAPYARIPSFVHTPIPSQSSLRIAFFMSSGRCRRRCSCTTAA